MAAWGKRYLVAQFVVFLHFGGQVRFLNSPANRYYFFWGTHHAVAHALDLLLLGVAIAAASVALESIARRLGWTVAWRLLQHVLPVALVSGLLCTFPTFSQLHHPTLTKLIWLAAMAVVGYSFARAGSRLVRYAHSACLLFSPITFIAIAQMFLWTRWYEPPRTVGTVRAASAPTTPVFVFFFDAWSAPRSLDGDEFRPILPHLRELARQAVVFPHALTGGDETHVSIPRFLYQTERRIRRRRGRLHWVDGDTWTPTDETPSLFQAARDAGYNTYMVGWGVPYQRLLGGQVDTCHAYRVAPRGETVGEEMLYALIRNMQFWTDPVSQRLARELDPLWRYPYLRRYTRRCEKATTDILTGCPSNSFAVFHWFLPHHPYIWTEEGEYRLPDDGPEAPQYERSLKCLDGHIGRLVARLRAEGKFDDALLLLTGDHTWRRDTEPRITGMSHWMLRSPLVIKLPGQTQPAVIRDEFRMTRLKPFFDAVLAGERSAERLLQVLRRTAAAAGAAKPPAAPSP